MVKSDSYHDEENKIDIVWNITPHRSSLSIVEINGFHEGAKLFSQTICIPTEECDLYVKDTVEYVKGLANTLVAVLRACQADDSNLTATIGSSSNDLPDVDAVATETIDRINTSFSAEELIYGPEHPQCRCIVVNQGFDDSNCVVSVRDIEGGEDD